MPSPIGAQVEVDMGLLMGLSNPSSTLNKRDARHQMARRLRRVRAGPHRVLAIRFVAWSVQVGAALPVHTERSWKWELNTLSKPRHEEVPSPDVVDLRD
jgi:hypothetical protein